MSNETSRKSRGNVNYYIPAEMGDSLDAILEQIGPKHCIRSRSELILRVLSTFIGFYEVDTYTRSLLSSIKLGDSLGSFLGTYAPNSLKKTELQHFALEILEAILNRADKGDSACIEIVKSVLKEKMTIDLQCNKSSNFHMEFSVLQC